MSISQGCNGSVCAVIGQFVSIWNIFLCPGVLDCFSVGFLRKTGYGLGPVVGCSQSRCCSCFFAICKKGYGDAIRTDSILVICISPQLGNGCTGLAWGVAVDDVVAIIGCGVVLYRGLAYGVSDFLAIYELRKVSEAVGPAAILVWSYRLTVHFFSICKKFHSNVLWAFAILIVCIIPGLGSADLGGFWYMGVDEVVAIQLGGVAFNSILGYGVSNFSILVVLWKFLKFIIPISISIRSYLLVFNFLTICKKVHGNACWTDSILVTIIIPGLGSGNLDFSYISIREINGIYFLTIFLNNLAYIQGSISGICHSYLYCVNSSVISNSSITSLNF